MLTIYQLESNIPIPNAIPGYRELLPNMKVGDSFLFPTHKAKNIRSLADHQGFKITMQTIGQGLARVWRVS